MGTQEDVELRKVELEEKKFEFETSKHSEWWITKATKNPMAIVALVGVVISFVQYRSSETSREQEMDLARANAETEDDRLWRVALIEFLQEQRADLFSDDKKKRQESIAMLEASFPSRYSTAVINKLQIIQGGDAAADPKVVVAELLEPLVKELDASKQAFLALQPNDTANEQKLREANRKARDLLVTKATLVPPELRQDALQLVEHYDAWFAEYERVRGPGKTDQAPFVFAGPAGFPVPQNAERKLREGLARRKG